MTCSSEFQLPADAPEHVRRLVEYNRRRCEQLLDAVPRRPVRSVGLVGAGLMGTAIAAGSLSAGFDVVLFDVDRDAAERAARWIDDGRLTVAERLDGLAGCDLVVESIAERLDAKQQLYAELEPLLSDEATLATNTSTIPIAQLAAKLARTQQFCAAHFFHPVGRRPLVEVVRGPQTSDSTVATAVGFAQSIGKMALVVGDGPGFVVNRLLMPYLTQAAELLLDGATIDQIESAATTFGMAKGPLHLIDEIGLDTAVSGGRVLWQAFPQRVVISPLMIAMYKAGRFGVKSKAGFFNYSDTTSDDDLPVDPIALEKIDQWSRASQNLTDEDIRDRLLLPMVVEAAWLLEEKKVDDPRDIDLGTIFGLGFPAARGGLLRWADTMGSERLVGRFTERYPDAELPPLLCRMADDDRPFHAPTGS